MRTKPSCLCFRFTSWQRQLDLTWADARVKSLSLPQPAVPEFQSLATELGEARGTLAMVGFPSFALQGFASNISQEETEETENYFRGAYPPHHVMHLRCLRYLL